jgi:hypothetical protein
MISKLMLPEKPPNKRKLKITDKSLPDDSFQLDKRMNNGKKQGKNEKKVKHHKRLPALASAPDVTSSGQDVTVKVTNKSVTSCKI